MEPGTNFDDYIRKPEEFGKCKEQSDCLPNDGSESSDQFEGDNQIGNGVEEKCKARISESDKWNNTGENFEDYIRKPEEWGSYDTNTNSIQDRSGNAGPNDRIIFPDDDLLKSENGTDKNESQSQPKSDDRIVFPDD
ncbi:hypothetical protein QE152_g15757 [Popillia japonica]|uniref:Uncharacterized protein n=1 Tax=Popillia japonica TaxID=7064 RepID=A0AAW1L4V5_POPJA